MWSIDWWLIDVCKKLCHMPPQKSGLFVKGLFTTKVLFSAEGSFVFFLGGGRMLGFPWILYMGMSQKKHKRCYQNQPFPKDFGEVPTFGNIPIWRHSPTGRLFLSPEVSLNRQASRHIKSRLQMQLLNLWCAFVAPISGWQMVFFFQLWHHFGRVQWLFGVAYWTTSCSPSSN